MKRYYDDLYEDGYQFGMSDPTFTKAVAQEWNDELTTTEFHHWWSGYQFAVTEQT